MGFKEGDFPHAEDIGRRTITLPLFPAMQDGDVDRVCSALAEVLASNCGCLEQSVE
jgi:dTDP-4-amino-4,6-dideoxygalactose transaminase